MLKPTLEPTPEPTPESTPEPIPEPTLESTPGQPVFKLLSLILVLLILYTS